MIPQSEELRGIRVRTVNSRESALTYHYTLPTDLRTLWGQEKMCVRTKALQPFTYLRHFIIAIENCLKAEGEKLL